MPETMNTSAMRPRTTAATIRPEELPDSVEGLTSSSSFGNQFRANLPPASGPACAKEVVYHIFAEMFWCRAEHASAVSLRHIINKRAQPIVFGQHEDVQSGMPPGHLVHLGQRQLDGLRRRRPVEPGPAVPLQVRGRLTVGDDQHHRLVLGVPV